MQHKPLFFILFFGCFTAFAQENTEANSPISADTVAHGHVNVRASARLTEMQVQYKKSNEGKPIAGYRIQLYSGSRQGALDLKKQFMQSLPEVPVTVVYESPDFKLQAGNYRSKLDAEQAMQTIWPLYKSAFVVKTKIDLPKLTIEK